MDASAPERKLLINAAADKRRRWPWIAPMPVADDSDLELVFAGVDPVTLTLARARDVIAGLSSDLQGLLPAAAASFDVADGLQGPGAGAAFLVAPGYAPIEVLVDSITATEIRLAEPLRISVPLEDIGAVLIWRLWTCLVPVAVTAAETLGEPIIWSVDYTGRPGAGVGSLPGMRDEGVVHVVRRIFDPGLDTSTLRSALGAGIVADIDHRAATQASAIATALGELIDWIRAQLTEAGDDRREDDLEGHRFRRALTRWTASVLLEGDRPTEATAQRKLAIEQARLALASCVRYASDDQPAVGRQALRGTMLAGGIAKDTPTGRAAYADRW